MSNNQQLRVQVKNEEGKWLNVRVGAGDALEVSVYRGDFETRGHSITVIEPESE